MWEHMHQQMDRARSVMYLEGSDQHRGWFQSSLLTSGSKSHCVSLIAPRLMYHAVAVTQTSPYHILLTHGFVVDEQGRKMSKSLGNVVSPNAIIDGHKVSCACHPVD